MTPRVLEIVRHFRENGLKLLLEQPGNARDLLALTGTRLLDRIDFRRLTVERTTYVLSDYRHVASDLVLRAPFRAGSGRRDWRSILLYILIEHQSERDPLMMLRVLEYLVQIWKGQLRAWNRRHRSVAGFRLQPILPVVFYTGTQRWDELGRLIDLVEQGELFEEMTPDFRPLFVSLPALPAAALESSGGHLGWVLELVQRREARPEEFRELLRRVVAHLETMPATERLRWLELLSYLEAMIYHDREPSEHEGLRDVVLASVQTDERRREVQAVARSMADVVREEGRTEGLRQGAVQALREVLMRLLRKQFGRVPKAVERAVNATDNSARLNTWIDRVLTAAALDDVGIESPDESVGG
jgi:hypothetical protein